MKNRGKFLKYLTQSEDEPFCVFIQMALYVPYYIPSNYAYVNPRGTHFFCLSNLVKDMKTRTQVTGEK